MISLEELTVDLRDKWLDYYEFHQEWILKLACWCNQPSQGKRPNAEFILALMGYLEPRLTYYLTPMLTINSGGEDVIEVLGLNFDPRIELEKRSNQCSNQCYQIRRLSYFLLINKPIKILNFSTILGLTFIPNVILRNELEKLAIFESIAYELIELENTEILTYESETYLDSNTQYLNEIRTKIKQGEL